MRPGPTSDASDRERSPIFAVGSENPVKIASVLDAVRRFWPGARVVGVAMDSSVPAQPLSDHETRQGALARARGALDSVQQASHGVGLEGGVLDLGDEMWATAWVVVVSRDGRTGAGKTGQFALPAALAALVRQGAELGEADDLFFRCQGSKRREGAIGLLSNGQLTRRRLYEHGVLFALLPFVRPELYAKTVASSDRRSGGQEAGRRPLRRRAPR
ncbi:MAG: DUF84 family protein [Candidatus Riflebacteria bacterium]|nr:DUF84 family protein [Candidatus Riflebacteria bacterium]